MNPRSSFTLPILAGLGLLFVSSLALAEQKPVPILSQHLTLVLPEAMRLEARGHGIMAAKESSADEARGVLDFGQARLVMMANELYARVPEDFAAAVKTLISEQEAGLGVGAAAASIEALALPAPLRGFSIAPAVDGTQEANLLLQAWIANHDGSIQEFAFYVNPEGSKDTAKLLGVARQILGTLQAGERTLAAKGGEQRITIGERALTLVIPEQWVFSTQEGPDFDVHHIRKSSRGVSRGQAAVSISVAIRVGCTSKLKRRRAKWKFVKRSFWARQPNGICGSRKGSRWRS